MSDQTQHADQAAPVDIDQRRREINHENTMRAHGLLQAPTIRPDSVPDRAEAAESSRAGAAVSCPDCNGTGGYTPAYVSGGEIVGPDACHKCSGTGEIQAPTTPPRDKHDLHEAYKVAPLLPAEQATGGSLEQRIDAFLDKKLPPLDWEQKIADLEAEVERLGVLNNELFEVAQCRADDTPLSSGKYPHKLTCSADWRKPLGCGLCSCPVGRQRKRADAAEAKLTAAEERERGLVAEVARLRALDGEKS